MIDTFYVLISNMYPKTKFTAKHWSDLCDFYTKVFFFFCFFLFFFLNFCLRNHILLFFAEFKLSAFCNNNVKISEKKKKKKKKKKKMNKWNLLKTRLQVTDPTYFCIVFLHFLLWEKIKILDFFKNHRLHFFVHR